MSETFDQMIERDRQAIADAGVPTEEQMREAEAPWPNTVEELAEYVRSLVERPHDYGTAVYATNPCRFDAVRPWGEPLMAFHVPESARIRTGRLASIPEDGNNGAFLVVLKDGQRAWCIASDGEGWEHVSVTMHGRKARCPTWAEMCQVKDLFWGPEDAVFQLHPPHSEYVNTHPLCLHLWRPIGITLPRPPRHLVG